MKSKILVVDDNSKNIQVLASLLTMAGYSVEYALNGKSAIQWASNSTFDAILLDLMMPEMDGFETCTAIKSIAGTENIPIIFITARDDAESITKAFKVGGVDYITKPFNRDELLARLSTHIDLKKSKEKLLDTKVWLEKEVEQKTKELREANLSIEKSFNELKKLDVAQNEFLKTISHEIRTPLTGIVGSISLLKSFTDNEDLVEVVELLEKSVTKLEHYSFVALQIAYLRLKGMQQLSVQEVNLNAIIKNCINNTLQQATVKQLEIRFKSNSNGIVVTGDHDMLNRSFLALIESSIAYSTNGVIDVEVSQNLEHIHCTISDAGTPFVSEKPMSIFDSINNHSNTYERNTNIELHLAQVVFLTHGWNLHFANKPNGDGTETIITIPIGEK
jgi:two-component system, sensor histidine kinase and response regulator